MKGKKRYIHLNESQRKELLLCFKTGKKPAFRMRCHLILLSDQGHAVQQIAQLYQTSRQSVARWFTRYEQGGVTALHTARGRGRRPVLRIDNTVEVQRVEQLVDQHPQNLQPVLAELSQQGKLMSKRTLQRFLKKLGGDGNGSEEALLGNPTEKYMNKSANN